MTTNSILLCCSLSTEDLPDSFDEFVNFIEMNAPDVSDNSPSFFVKIIVDLKNEEYATYYLELLMGLIFQHFKYAGGWSIDDTHIPKFDNATVLLRMRPATLYDLAK